VYLGKPFGWNSPFRRTSVAAGLRAVNLGDDADTNGAICGQLAGAFWGETNIPESLRSGLARMDMLENAVAGILGA
jgi:ADP-ribosyl-[dinitrogen reductase] hydrolase